jgi:hypothetical protein
LGLNVYFKKGINFMELVLPAGVDRLTQSQKIVAGGLGIGP